MNNKQMTHKEHFVPRVYLEGFASSLGMVHVYELKSDYYKGQPIPLASICYKKDLYELKLDKETYLFPNLIEKQFGNFEAMFNGHKKSLSDAVARAKSGEKMHDFMSVNDMSFWVTFVIQQFVRSPRMIAIRKAVLKKNSSLSYSDLTWENIAKLDVLPSGLVGLPPVMGALFSKYEDANVYVGYTDKNCLWTSDIAVYSEVLDAENNIAVLNYPITSNMVLAIHPKCDSDGRHSNIGVLTDEDVDEIRAQIVCQASKRIISANEFTREDISFIKQMRQYSIPDEEVVEKISNRVDET